MMQHCFRFTNVLQRLTTSPQANVSSPTSTTSSHLLSAHPREVPASLCSHLIPLVSIPSHIGLCERIQLEEKGGKRPRNFEDFLRFGQCFGFVPRLVLGTRVDHASASSPWTASSRASRQGPRWLNHNKWRWTTIILLIPTTMTWLSSRMGHRRKSECLQCPFVRRWRQCKTSMGKFVCSSGRPFLSISFPV